MENPVTSARRKIAARLEAEIIGAVLPPNPCQPQAKGQIERAMAQYIRGAISRKDLRARLTDIASGVHEGRIAAIRIQAAKIRPRDLVAAVEQVRQRDEAARLGARLDQRKLQEGLPARAIGLILPEGSSKSGNLTNEQFQHQIARHFRADIRVTFGHMPFPISSADDGSKR